MKRRGDLRLLLAALVLLAIPLLYALWGSRSAIERREAVLAGVPQFPAPHQAPRRNPLPVTPPPRPLPAPAAPRATPQDPIAAFVLSAGDGAALVQVNALFNTPLFDKLRECLPEQFRELEGKGHEIGIDLAHDVDRIALAPEGVAMSGFFQGKNVAEAISGPGARSDTYRGATIFTREHGWCAAQLGNLVVSGSDCKALVDRALQPAPANAGEELYGDVYMRSDLAGLRGDSTPEVRALVDGLQGLTMRANVWDSVALTVEADPRNGRSPAELAQMAQGALALVKSQLGEDDVELRALADLARVGSDGKKLELNLALPVKDLFDRFKLPCPGRPDAGSTP